MDLEDLKNLIVILYTIWKFYTEWKDRRKKDKRKERIKGKPRKHRPKKRSKR